MKKDLAMRTMTIVFAITLILGTITISGFADEDTGEANGAAVNAQVDENDSQVDGADGTVDENGGTVDENGGTADENGDLADDDGDLADDDVRAMGDDVSIDKSSEAAGISGFDYEAFYKIVNGYGNGYVLGYPGLNNTGDIFTIGIRDENTGMAYPSFCANAGSHSFAGEGGHGCSGYLVSMEEAPNGVPCADFLKAYNYIEKNYGTVDSYRAVTQIVTWALLGTVDVRSEAFDNINWGAVETGTGAIMGIPGAKAIVKDVMDNYRSCVSGSGEIVSIAFMVCELGGKENYATCQPQLVPIYGSGDGSKNKGKYRWAKQHCNNDSDIEEPGDYEEPDDFEEPGYIEELGDSGKDGGSKNKRSAGGNLTDSTFGSVSEEDVTIPNQDVPLGFLPETDIAPIDLTSEEVPLGDIPQTGVEETALGLGLLGLSLSALLALLISKKRKEN
ncbi:MAG: LPXTG cell wall anchor domain-containing protein [Clostridiales bacterium]|nr:LPXTG cell wall anchor domain-containing protein [Clostridiales bacterium]